MDKVKTATVFFIAVLIIGGWVYNNNLSSSSTISFVPSSSSELPVLDFSELAKFNSLEEIKGYRFEMRVGKVYRLQDKEYHYLGGGKMLVKDFSDPEYVKEYRWILQVGVGPVIGTWGYDKAGKPLPGRGYRTTAIKVESVTVLFRIEEMWSG